MKISFRTIAGSIFALLVPGLGHFLCGTFMWGFFWLFMGMASGGTANIVAAIHVLMLESK